MNFEPTRQDPHEMYMAMGWEQYQAPVREIDPYVELSMTTAGYGLLDQSSDKETQPFSLNNSDPERDEAATGIARGHWTDPVQSALDDKVAFSERLVGDLIGMIQKREELRDGHITNIDGESCHAMGRVFGVEQWHPAMNRDADKVRANAEKEISGLEREKRMEEIACWRDTSRLRMELHEKAREWLGERRRQSFVFDGLK